MAVERQDGVATRNAILEAAEDIFAERGYAGTSISEIAKRSGASGPLIMSHFKNKRGVFQAMKAAVVERYEDHAIHRDEHTVASVEDWLERVIRSKFEHYKHNQNIHRLVDWCRLEGDTELWPGIQEWHDHYTALYQQLVTRGEARSDVLPFNIMLTVSGAIHLWWEYRDQHLQDMGAEAEPDQVDEAYVCTLIQSLNHGISCK